jgi:glutamate N-acetyltransferase/amino-acid N-acetyltransferase
MSITVPAGFRAAGVTAGLKSSGDPDVAVVLSDGPSYAAAAVFTANRVQAAPVRWTRQAVRGGRLRAVVLNSGCANACTAPAGDADTRLTARRLADATGLPAAEIAVCSTGLIGRGCRWSCCCSAVDKAAAAADGVAARRPPTRQDDGHGAEGSRPARPGVRDRRDGQGRSHAGARPRDHALRPHHRRRPGRG